MVCLSSMESEAGARMEGEQCRWKGMAGSGARMARDDTVDGDGVMWGEEGCDSPRMTGVARGGAWCTSVDAHVTSL